MPNIANSGALHLPVSLPAGAALPARKLGALFSWLVPSGLVGHLREYRRRQRMMVALPRLNGRELRDSRPNRTEISEIFTPESAEPRAGEDGGKGPPDSSERIEPGSPGRGPGVGFCMPGEIAHILRRRRDACRSSAPRM